MRILQNVPTATLRDLKSYEEPGTVAYLADRVELMLLMPAEREDAVS